MAALALELGEWAAARSEAQCHVDDAIAVQAQQTKQPAAGREDEIELLKYLVQRPRPSVSGAMAVRHVSQNTASRHINHLWRVNEALQ